MNTLQNSDNSSDICGRKLIKNEKYNSNRVMHVGFSRMYIVFFHIIEIPKI